MLNKKFNSVFFAIQDFVIGDDISDIAMQIEDIALEISTKKFYVKKEVYGEYADMLLGCMTKYIVEQNSPTCNIDCKITDSRIEFIFQNGFRGHSTSFDIYYDSQELKMMFYGGSEITLSNDDSIHYLVKMIGLSYVAKNCGKGGEIECTIAAMKESLRCKMTDVKDAQNKYYNLKHKLNELKQLNQSKATEDYIDALEINRVYVNSEGEAVKYISRGKGITLGFENMYTGKSKRIKKKDILSYIDNDSSELIKTLVIGDSYDIDEGYKYAEGYEYTLKQIVLSDYKRVRIQMLVEEDQERWSELFTLESFKKKFTKK